MSRESDTSSSGPQGRGGAAYPSGTPPYGTRDVPPGAPGGDEPAGPPTPEEPKTETTMTTRIRINIPGSRPIPPVIMRTPVEDGTAGKASAAPDPAARPGTPSAGPDRAAESARAKPSLPRRPEPSAKPAAAPEADRGDGKGEKASDWFAPRKSGPAAPAAAPAPGLPRRQVGQSAPPPVTPPPVTPQPPAASGGAPWVRDTPGDASAQPPAPAQGSTTGSVPWQGAAPAAPAASGGAPWVRDTSGPAAPAGGAPWQDRQNAAPWPGESSVTGAMAQPTVPGQNSAGAPPWAEPETTQQFQAPSLDDPFVYPQGSAAAGAFAPGRTDTPREGFPAIQTPPPAGGAPRPPQAKQPGQQAQQAAPAKQSKKRKSKVPAPTPPVGQMPGETLVSGVPPVSPGGSVPKPVDSGAPRVAVPKPKSGVPAPKPAAPAAKSAPKAAAKSAPKKKGRSKLVLLGGGLVALVGVAYGAGLLLDHADVPNGTTVLGVDIGGTSKEAAVKKLDSALGERATAPLTVSIAGKEAQLKPSVAGLSIDTQATVRAAAGRDYNPVTVLGSLVGGTRKAEPTLNVDEEKVAAALKTLAGESGAAKDGTIKFEPGKAVPVYGKPYQGLDNAKAVKAVSDAYRERAAGGASKTVELPSAPQTPKIGNAEVDRVMASFAKPAMSGLVTVQTDAAHRIQFGPDLSLPKILSVKEVDGKLVESYNLEALKELYGSRFNGVLIQRGNGTKTAVTPQDVVGALRKALVGKTPAERIGVIPLNPS
ncbi:hypothetical protein WEB32_22240 [Streptomyces netropsis]|uniref:hypothetical protein n=1 Tax=Streptomyces netropsis TaxID=55404 RepID=UPI0030CC3604